MLQWYQCLMLFLWPCWQLYSPLYCFRWKRKPSCFWVISTKKWKSFGKIVRQVSRTALKSKYLLERLLKHCLLLWKVSMASIWVSLVMLLDLELEFDCFYSKAYWGIVDAKSKKLKIGQYFLWFEQVHVSSYFYDPQGVMKTTNLRIVPGQ